MSRGRARGASAPASGPQPTRLRRSRPLASTDAEAVKDVFTPDALEDELIAAYRPVWGEHGLPIPARADDGHPSSWERALRALAGLAKLGAALVAPRLEREIRGIARSSDVTVAAEGTHVAVRADARLGGGGLSRIDHPAGNHLVRREHDVPGDRNAATTAMTGLPMSLGHRRSRPGRRPLPTERSRVVASALGFSGIHQAVPRARHPSTAHSTPAPRASVAYCGTGFGPVMLG